MFIFSRRFQIVLGILMLSLFDPMVLGEGLTPERLQAQASTALSVNQASVKPGTVAKADLSGKKAITNESDKGSVQGGFSDGRGGFWIVGILINLSVLGWFLIWAVKEWRKNKDD